jgi:hypothetical protein
MRHSYATWLREAGADLRWLKDRLGHASIEETQGTYGHLERVRHERRVDLDAVLGGVQARPPASTLLDAGGAPEGQLHDFPSEDLVVEGKGFVTPDPPSTSNFATPHLPQAAPSGIPRPPTSTAPDPSPDSPPAPSAPRPADPREWNQEQNRDDLLTTNPGPTQQDQENPSKRTDDSSA